jgi:hypothetical protein
MRLQIWLECIFFNHKILLMLAVKSAVSALGITSRRAMSIWTSMSGRVQPTLDHFVPVMNKKRKM